MMRNTYIIITVKIFEEDVATETAWRVGPGTSPGVATEPDGLRAGAAGGFPNGPDGLCPGTTGGVTTWFDDLGTGTTGGVTIRRPLVGAL